MGENMRNLSGKGSGNLCCFLSDLSDLSDLSRLFLESVLLGDNTLVLSGRLSGRLSASTDSLVGGGENTLERSCACGAVCCDVCDISVELSRNKCRCLPE